MELRPRVAARKSSVLCLDFDVSHAWAGTKPVNFGVVTIRMLLIVEMQATHEIASTRAHFPISDVPRLGLVFLSASGHSQIDF